jgi:hypothetical protein
LSQFPSFPDTTIFTGKDFREVFEATFSIFQKKTHSNSSSLSTTHPIITNVIPITFMPLQTSAHTPLQPKVLVITIIDEPVIIVLNPQSTPIIEEISHQSLIYVEYALSIPPLSPIHTDTKMVEREFIETLATTDESTTIVPFPSVFLPEKVPNLDLQKPA